jgi:hypothetical protein
MRLETDNWSGEGELTQAIVDRLRALGGIAYLRIEDAPASREDSGFTFVSNEMFAGLAPEQSSWWRRVFQNRPARPPVDAAPALLLTIRSWLEADAGIGAPDYADDGMLQYLRTTRIVPPYQTRGIKLVELVRIYALGTTRG